jgi:queuine tRNA-ribosyltransferase
MTPAPAAVPVRFHLTRQDTSTGARLGRVTTPNGAFDTPAFMPVGTQGTIKGLLPDHVAATGSQCILANTYHLMLRPGEQTVAELGDLHRFMAWPGPILTDSGGFQVFSLADVNKVTDEKVVFKSHVDGAMVELTPERSIRVQNALGADIIMAFDECPPGDAPRDASGGPSTGRCGGPRRASVPTSGRRAGAVRHRAGRGARGLRAECAAG